jgi:hypothetical protein
MKNSFYSQPPRPKPATGEGMHKSTLVHIQIQIIITVMLQNRMSGGKRNNRRHQSSQPLVLSPLSLFPWPTLFCISPSSMSPGEIHGARRCVREQTGEGAALDTTRRADRWSSCHRRGCAQESSNRPRAAADTRELLPPLASLQVRAVAACRASDRRRSPLNRVLGGRAVATRTRQRTRIRWPTPLLSLPLMSDPELWAHSQ